MCTSIYFVQGTHTQTDRQTDRQTHTHSVSDRHQWWVAHVFETGQVKVRCDRPPTERAQPRRLRDCPSPSSPYHFLQDRLAGRGGCNGRGDLGGAGGLAERLGGRGLLLRLGGEGLLTEVVECDAPRFALLGRLPVGHGAPRGGKVHGVESGDMPHTITACVCVCVCACGGEVDLERGN